MAAIAPGCFGEIVVDGARHAAHEQDALGADRARRRHRHHLDRRHDVADPRLRQIAARLDPRSSARTPSSCRSSARSASRRARASSRSRERPNITIEDARAIERDCPSVGAGRRLARGDGGNDAVAHLLRPRQDERSRDPRRDGELGRGQLRKLELGRLFIPSEVEHRRQVVVLGQDPWRVAVPEHRSDRQKVRIGGNEFTVIGVLGKRPSPGGFSSGADDFAVIPFTRAREVLRQGAQGSAKISGGQSSTRRCSARAMIAVVPRERRRATQAMREVEAVMRIRHSLKLDEPNDFDLVTQDAMLKVWDQISQATFLALVVISLDRADGRRHRRDGDHDDLGHRADARDRRPQGARRPPPRDPVAVPDRSGLPDVGRRRARHHLRQQHRPDRPLALGLPGLAALVVVRDRHRLLGQRSASSSACSPPSRRRGWIRSKRCDTSRSATPAASFQLASFQLRQSSGFQFAVIRLALARSRETRRIAMQDYRKLQRVAESAHAGARNATRFRDVPARSPTRGRCAIRCSGRRFRCRRTSPKAPAEARIAISGGFCSTPWDPATNLSMICFLPGTSGSCPCRRIPGSRATLEEVRRMLSRPLLSTTLTTLTRPAWPKLATGKLETAEAGSVGGHPL